MDVPTANQSQPACHTWVGQEDWSPRSHTQLQSLQHLTLSSTCSQGFVPGTLQVNRAQPTRGAPGPSSITPPPSLPPLDPGTRPHTANQTPFNPSSLHRAVSPPFLLFHPHQMPQDAAWSPHQEHTHAGSGGPGPDANRSPACSPEPAFGLGNVTPADGFGKSPASPTSPTAPLHQPPDGVSSRYIGPFIWINLINKTKRIQTKYKPATLWGRKQAVCLFLNSWRFVYLKMNCALFLGNINSQGGDATTQVRNHKVGQKRQECFT